MPASSSFSRAFLLVIFFPFFGKLAILGPNTEPRTSSAQPTRTEGAPLAKRTKTLYVCQECGLEKAKWEGRCSGCGAWDSFVERRPPPDAPEPVRPNLAEEVAAAMGGQAQTTPLTDRTKLKPHSLATPLEVKLIERQQSGITEFDRVTGGGIVPGSFMLIGGDPGIGKSTLILQICSALLRARQDQNSSSSEAPSKDTNVDKKPKVVLYASGEESVEQVSLRAQRLGIAEAGLLVVNTSDLHQIARLIEEYQPSLLVIDSIQTLQMSTLRSAPGSVAQVRECTAQLMGIAKSRNLSILLIGHVTKDGHLAGPKTLEHMVDVVLSFEGDSHHQFRLLRSTKNRFGSIFELGVFRMQSHGLVEVSNPSEMFLEERAQDSVGSVVFPLMEGNRPLLCEIQALTTPTPMAMPRRTVVGLDLNRLHLLVAVLERHGRTNLSEYEIFANVVGGLKVHEPAADLAIAAALISTESRQPIREKTCFFGEIGLTGEIRAVPFASERVAEAAKLGFETFVLPKTSAKAIQSRAVEQSSSRQQAEKALHYLWLDTVNDLVRTIHST